MEPSLKHIRHITTLWLNYRRSNEPEAEPCLDKFLTYYLKMFPYLSSARPSETGEDWIFILNKTCTEFIVTVNSTITYPKSKSHQQKIQLKDYLLKNNGWKTLAFLCNIGLEGLKSCDSLMDMILALVKEFLSELEEESTSQNSLLDHPQPSINNLFHKKYHFKSEHDIFKLLKKKAKTLYFKGKFRTLPKFPHDLSPVSSLETVCEPVFPQINFEHKYENITSVSKDPDTEDFFSKAASDISASISIDIFKLYFYLLELLFDILQENEKGELLKKGCTFFFSPCIWKAISNIKNDSIRSHFIHQLLRIGFSTFHSFYISDIETTHSSMLKYLFVLLDEYSFNFKDRMDLMKCIIYVIYHYAQNNLENIARNSNISKVSYLVELFSLNNGPQLCIELLNMSSSGSLSEESMTLIELIKDTVIMIKCLRFCFLNQINFINRYDKYELLSIIHHHLDFQETSSTVLKTPICSINILCQIFIKTLSIHTSSEFLKNLRFSLKISGICCCFEEENTILSVINTANSDQLFDSLNLIKIGILKCLGLTCKYSSFEKCQSCFKKISLKEMETLYSVDDVDYPRNASFPCMFQKYRELLNDKNPKIASAIGRHLYDILKTAKKDLLDKIFTKTILPEFLIHSVNYKEIDDNIPLKYSVAALHLLLRERRLMKMFNDCKGVDNICSLLKFPAIRHIAILPFEVSLNTNAMINNFDETALETFFKLLEKQTSNFLSNSIDENQLYDREESSSKDDVSKYEEEEIFLQMLWDSCRHLVFNNVFFQKELEKRNSVLDLLNKLLLNTAKDVIKSQHTFKRELIESKCFFLESLLRISIQGNIENSNTKLDKILEELFNILSQFHPSQPIFIRILFNSLIQCCQQIAKRDKMDSTVKLRLMFSEQEEEVLENSESGSSSDQEDGYEADIELADSPDSVAVWEHSSASMNDKQFKKRIKYTRALKLLLKLLQSYHQAYSLGNHEWINCVCLMMKDFQKLILDCDKNMNILFEMGLVKMLYSCFQDILQISSPDLKEIQCTLLQLIIYQYNYHCTPKDVTFLFSLLKHKCAPLYILTLYFNKLSHITLYQPYSFFTFPVQIDDHQSLLNRSQDFSAITIPLKVSIENCISISCWIAPFKTNLNIKNLSVSSNTEFDVRYPRGIVEGDIYHLLTFRFGDLSIQVWISLLSRSFYFRFLDCTLGNGKDLLLLGEQNTGNVLDLGHWQHVAFEFTRILIKENLKKQNIQGTIYVGGEDPLSFSTILPYNPTKNLKEYSISVGHVSCSISTYNFGYHIGNILLFADQVFSKEICYYLASLGPDYTYLTSTLLQGQQPYAIFKTNYSFPNYILDLDPLVFTGLKTPSFQKLQETLLMVYAPSKPANALIYPKTEMSNNSFLSSISDPQRRIGFKIASEDVRKSQKLPQMVPVKSEVDLNMISTTIEDLPRSLTKLGGVSNLLFFFAKIVESSSDNDIQALALEFVFKNISLNNQLANQFIKLDGFCLLSQVLLSKHCVMSYRILEVYLNVALSGPPILTFNAETGKGVVDFNSSAFICNPNALSSLISLSFSWDSEELLQDFFLVLKCLLQDDHPYKDFNYTQMTHVKTLNHLLFHIQDLFMTHEKNYLTKESIYLLTFIILQLFGPEPTFSDFKNVISTLLFLHDSSFSFASYAKSSFYYLMNYESSSHEKPKKSSSLSQFYGSTSSSNSETHSEEDLASEGASPKSKSNSFSSNYPRKNSIQTDHNLNDLRCGLMNVLHSLLTNVKQDILERFLEKIYFWKELLVLTNTSDVNMCILVLKTLFLWLEKASAVQVAEFYKMKGFFLLANQLHQQNVCCLELLNISFSLAVGNTIRLQDNEPITYEKDSGQPLAFALIFSMIPATSTNHQLCSLALNAISNIWSNNSNVQLIFFELGFLETLGNLLLKLEGVESSYANVFQPNIIFIIGEMIGKISIYFLRNGGHFYWKSFEEILYCLSGFEPTALCSSGISAFINFRTSQCCLLEHTIDFIHEYWSWEERMTDLFFIPTEIPKFSDSLVFLTESKKTPKTLTTKEMTERTHFILDYAFNFIIYRYPKDRLADDEIKFLKFFFKFLVESAGKLVEKDSKDKPRWYQILQLFKDSIFSQLNQLLVYILENEHVCEWPTQYSCLNIILSEPFFESLLVHIAINPFSNALKLSNLLNNLKMKYRSTLIDYEEETIDSFLKIIESRKEYFRMTNKDVLKEHLEKTQAESEAYKKWQLFKSKKEKRVVSKYDTVSKRIAKFGSEITKAVVNIIQDEHKHFHTELKKAYHSNMMARKGWQHIIEHLSHERAPWFFKELYPKSWEADPTEGPGRVRRRLRRCHLNCESRFIKEEYHCNLKPEESCSILGYLFESEGPQSDSSLLIENLLANEKIKDTFPCSIVTPTSDVKGEILLGDQCIYFVGEHKLDQSSYLKDLNSQAWSYIDIKDILPRRYMLKEIALEIFLTSGLTYLITFLSKDNYKSFWNLLSESTLAYHTPQQNLSLLIQQWRDRILTNFEYLTQLNKQAGRTFNDIMQYPIFPFVLTDYSSPVLNLKNPQIYRNFSRPVPVQNKERESYFINYYNTLKDDPHMNPLSGFPISDPFHYSSLYSNSALVLQYLIRLQPFTHKFLQFQGNNFDNADRSFHSMDTCWRLASQESTSDTKEMIPEFFFLPEFLVNITGFELGRRQDGRGVDKVELPPWCQNKPRFFVLIMRQALESDYVTNNLHRWLDLIFGFKQSGKHSVDAVNVYHPSTHYDQDITHVTDPLTQLAIQTMIREYGQIPIQLFTSPHPMSAQNLVSVGDSTSNYEALKEVVGCKWGNYLGSPSCPGALLSWKRKFRYNSVGSLLSLPTHDIYWLPPYSCLLVSFNNTKGFVNSTYLESAALVTWNNPDYSLRIRCHPDHSSEPVYQARPSDPISICASAQNCHYLVVGFSSGLIKVFNLIMDPVMSKVIENKLPVRLCGHTGPITSLCISVEFSILVSGSEDATYIIWDSNRLSYVLTIDSHPSTINFVCVSPTLGDIASVSNSEQGCLLQLHTINGEFISSSNLTEHITALCFSSCPEGQAINVIATGLDTGVIRLFNTWTLDIVTDIQTNSSSPIISMTYSFDNLHLLAASREGAVHMWEIPNKKPLRKPNFKSLIWQS